MHIFRKAIYLTPSVMFTLCMSLPLPCHDLTFCSQAGSQTQSCVQSGQSVPPSAHPLYSRVSLLCMTTVHHILTHTAHTHDLMQLSLLTKLSSKVKHPSSSNNKLIVKNYKLRHFYVLM